MVIYLLGGRSDYITCQIYSFQLSPAAAGILYQELSLLPRLLPLV